MPSTHGAYPQVTSRHFEVVSRSQIPRPQLTTIFRAGSIPGSSTQK
jgi:hypothetical protein